jgi:hypothetical protein
MEAHMGQQMEQAVKKAGYAKVRLSYVVPQATSSLVSTMKAHGGEKAETPVKEATTILIRAERAFSLLASYQDAFEMLKDAKAIPFSARLMEFQLLPLDDRTLAHVITC